MIRQELRRFLCIFSCFMAITCPVKTAELTSENALYEELLDVNEMPALEVIGGDTQTSETLQTFSNDLIHGTTEAIEEEGSGEVPIDTSQEALHLFPTTQHSTPVSKSTTIQQLTTSNIPTTQQLTSSYLLTLDPAPDNADIQQLTTTSPKYISPTTTFLPLTAAYETLNSNIQQQTTSVTIQGQSEESPNDGSYIGEYYVYLRQVSFVENPLHSDSRRDIIHCALSCSSLTSCTFFIFLNRACSLYAGNDTATTYMAGAVIYKRKM